MGRKGYQGACLFSDRSADKSSFIAGLELRALSVQCGPSGRAVGGGRLHIITWAGEAEDRERKKFPPKVSLQPVIWRHLRWPSRVSGSLPSGHMAGFYNLAVRVGAGRWGEGASFNSRLRTRRAGTWSSMFLSFHLRNRCIPQSAGSNSLVSERDALVSPWTWDGPVAYVRHLSPLF